MFMHVWHQLMTQVHSSRLRVASRGVIIALRKMQSMLLSGGVNGGWGLQNNDRNMQSFILGNIGAIESVLKKIVLILSYICYASLHFLLVTD